MTLPPLKRHLMVSIRPEYALKILDGEKTVELRRRFPEATATGATALIYSSSPVSALVGSARIREVFKLPVAQLWRTHGTAACISKAHFNDYFSGVASGFAIILENVVQFERHLSVDVLKGEYGVVPPQSYRYVDGLMDQIINDERLQAPYRHQRRHRA